jgi:hypothetical protein
MSTKRGKSRPQPLRGPNCPRPLAICDSSAFAANGVSKNQTFGTGSIYPFQGPEFQKRIALLTAAWYPESWCGREKSRRYLSIPKRILL